MGIANFPFPSFTLLLTSNRVVIPGPSYVIILAPLVIETFFLSSQLIAQAKKQCEDKVDDDLIEEHYPLANLDFENDPATDGHCDCEQFTDGTRTSSTSTGSVQKVIALTGRAEEEEVSAGFGKKLNPRPTARFQLKNIFKRLSQFKLNSR